MSYNDTTKSTQDWFEEFCFHYDIHLNQIEKKDWFEMLEEELEEKKHMNNIENEIQNAGLAGVTSTNLLKAFIQYYQWLSTCKTEMQEHPEFYISEDDKHGIPYSLMMFRAVIRDAKVLSFNAAEFRTTDIVI